MRRNVDSGKAEQNFADRKEHFGLSSKKCPKYLYSITVAETIDDEVHCFTEISIPMTEMNTEELAVWLGTDKSRSG